MPEHSVASNLVSYDRWLDELGITPTTGWRWRKRGVIETINIYGRVYISREQITRFEQRAAAGEFSLTQKIPGRRTRSNTAGG